MCVSPEAIEKLSTTAGKRPVGGDAPGHNLVDVRMRRSGVAEARWRRMFIVVGRRVKGERWNRERGSSPSCGGDGRRRSRPQVSHTQIICDPVPQNLGLAKGSGAFRCLTRGPPEPLSAIGA